MIKQQARELARVFAEPLNAIAKMIPLDIGEASKDELVRALQEINTIIASIPGDRDFEDDFTAIILAKCKPSSNGPLVTECPMGHKAKKTCSRCVEINQDDWKQERDELREELAKCKPSVDVPKLPDGWEGKFKTWAVDYERGKGWGGWVVGTMTTAPAYYIKVKTEHEAITLATILNHVAALEAKSE